MASGSGTQQAVPLAPVKPENRLPALDFVVEHDPDAFAVEVPSTVVRRGGYVNNCIWNLTDPLGTTHRVHYERDGDLGLLTEGWRALRTRLHFSGRCIVILKCTDRCNYDIVIFYEDQKQIKYHGWQVQTAESDVRKVHHFLGLPIPMPRPTIQIIPNSTVVLINSETNNPGFNVTLTSNHVNGSFLDLPVRIVEHLTQFGSGPVILSGNRGDFECRLVFAKGRPGTGKFGSGWKTFVKEYELQEGDVCAFSFTNMGDRIVNVQVALRPE